MPNGIETHVKERVRSEVGLTVEKASQVVDAIFEAISAYLSEGERVQIQPFGAFTVTHRARRMGRNPATGETIWIPASKNIKFKAARNLKDAVNQ